MLKSNLLLAAATLSALTLVGCATDAPDTPAEQQALQHDSQSALDKMYDRAPNLRPMIDGSYAYAIFPSVGKGAIIAGGASGRGEVYEQGRLIGYAELNQLTVGAQLGGQEYAELIVFETPTALHKFQDKEYSFSANASAVALKAGASSEGHFRDGVAIFTLPTGGLMAEASVGGQSFKYQPVALGAADTDAAQTATYRETGDSEYRTTTTTERPAPIHRQTETRTEIRTENP